MSNENLSPFLTKPVSAALAAAIVAGTTKKYCGVILNASGQLDLPTAGASIFGVLYSADVKAVGDRAKVAIVGSGQLFLRAGGTIAVADDLKVDSSGNFITCIAGDVAAGKKVATCTDSGTSGSIASGTLSGGTAITTVSGDEVVTSGNLSVQKDESDLSITNTVAFTLPDGLFIGQKHRVECVAVSGTPIGTLTVTTPITGEPTAYDIRATGVVLDYEWMTIGASTGWHLIGKKRSGKRTFVLGTDPITTSTAEVVDLSVTGTQSAAFPNGQVAGETVHVSVSTAATLPAGTLTGTYKDKLGAAKTVSISGLDATSDYVWLLWDGSAWNEIVSTGVTFN